MSNNPFHLVQKEIINDRRFYLRAAARYLKQFIGNKETAIEPGDVFQQTFCSYLKPGGKKRHWRINLPVRPQFLKALRSTAFYLTRRYRDHTTIELDEETIANTSDITAGQHDIYRVLKEYYNWIITGNKVELFFILNEMLEQQQDKFIADKFNLTGNRVKKVKYRIRNDIRRKL